MKTLPAESRGSDLRFLLTERDLPTLDGKRFPIRLFSLDGLGVDAERFVDDLAPSFARLPWDPYDVPRDRVRWLKARFPDASDRLDRFLHACWSDPAGSELPDDLLARLAPDERALLDAMSPYRRRAIARFRLHAAGSAWESLRVPVDGFTQRSPVAGDVRTVRRVFAPMDDAVAGHPEFVRLLAALGHVAQDHWSSVRVWEVTCHQMRLECGAGAAASNAPEGIHQDGADAIVSAIVVEREGVTGGESRIYGPDRRRVLLARTLEVGEGLFQADARSPLWHDVTPVRLSGGGVGVRSIVGFDLRAVGWAGGEVPPSRETG